MNVGFVESSRSKYHAGRPRVLQVLGVLQGFGDRTASSYRVPWSYTADMVPTLWQKPAAVAVATVALMSSMSSELLASDETFPSVFRLDRAAIARAAAAVPALRQSESTDDWPRVAALTPGRRIVVATRSGEPQVRQFVAADDATLIVAVVPDTGLPGEVLRVVRGLDAQELARVAGGMTIVRDRVRLGPDGIFLDASRVGDVEMLFSRVPRDDIDTIQLDRRSSTSGALVTGVVLLGAGIVLMEPTRHPEAISPRRMVGSGMVIAGLWTTSRVMQRRRQPGDVVYQRPASAVTSADIRRPTDTTREIRLGSRRIDIGLS